MLPSATRSRRSALNCTLRLSREAQTPSRLLSRLRRGSRSLCNPHATEADQTPARVNVTCVTPLGEEMASTP
jgi:hypothetical protein